MSKVIRIEKRHPETALENLNRLTGLDFQSWPESLLETGQGIEPRSGNATTVAENDQAPARVPAQ